MFKNQETMILLTSRQRRSIHQLWTDIPAITLPRFSPLLCSINLPTSMFSKPLPERTPDGKL